MREIPRIHRSSRTLLTLNVTSHIEDKIPPSPRRLLNTEYARWH